MENMTDNPQPPRSPNRAYNPPTPPQYVDEEEKSDDGNGNVDVESSHPDCRRRSSAKYKKDEDPFGDESSNDVKYKTMKWWQTSAVMVAETISLGILSLPSVLKAVGFIPGVILIIALGVIATYTGYVLGQFKIRYKHVHNMADAGEVLLGKIGREVFGFAQCLFLVFIMASHVLTFSIMMNVITVHGACTVVFTVVGMVVSFLATVPRTMEKMSYLCVVSFISVLVAVVITIVGVATDDRQGKLESVANTEFSKGFLAVSDIIFAYAGHLAFFSFISEMKRPEEYTKALYLLQFTDTVLYLIAAVVIYRYTGSEVTSPALGSTTPTLQKVAYGIAIPTIIVAGVVNAHVCAKYIFVRLFRGTGVMGSKSFKANAAWLSILAGIWLLGWIIANAIPSFNNLLALISALFVSWFTYGISGVFWLFLNKGKWFSSPRKIFLFVINSMVVLMGCTIMGVGLYASGKAIHDEPGGGSFSCADNSKPKS